MSISFSIIFQIKKGVCFLPMQLILLNRKTAETFQAQEGGSKRKNKTLSAGRAENLNEPAHILLFDRFYSHIMLKNI